MKVAYERGKLEKLLKNKFSSKHDIGMNLKACQSNAFVCKLQQALVNLHTA